MPIPRSLLSALVAATLLLTGCGSDDAEAAATPTTEVDGRHQLSGEVVIRDADEVSHLPDGARVVIRLLDISLQDTASVMIAESTSTSITLPLTYELRWDTELEPGRDYSVSAEVRSAAGDLLFVSDTVHPFQPGDSDVTVELIAV